MASISNKDWSQAEKDLRDAAVAEKRDRYKITGRAGFSGRAIELDRSDLVQEATVRLGPDSAEDPNHPDQFLQGLPYPEHDLIWTRELDGDDDPETPRGRREYFKGIAALPGAGWSYVSNTFFPQPLYWLGLGVPDVEKLNNFYFTYYALVDPIPSGRVRERWHTDQFFADQRVAGVNPMMIRRVTDASSIDEMGHSVFTDSHLQRIEPMQTLAGAAADRRLYVCDYHHLVDVVVDQGNPLPPALHTLGARQFLNAPIALFYWSDSGSPGTAATTPGKLVPVGIQLRRGAGATVVLPGEPNWLLAKTVVQTADAHVHELRVHLAWTHLKLEAVKLCAERELHDDHPVLRLLRPHLELLLRIQVDLGKLINEGEPVDELLAPTLSATSRVVLDALDEPFCMHANPEIEVASRGMSAAEAPIDYPYRDDGLGVWNALREFVTTYIGIYYPNDDTVTKDYELERFVAAVGPIGAGNVTGFVPGDAVSTVDKLITMVMTIIWNAGPQHSAINYPQWDFMGHVPNMPLSTYIKAPLDGFTPPEYPGLVSSLAQYFPPDLLARTQVGVMFFLATYRHNTFGHYGGALEDGISDDVERIAVREGMLGFRAALDAVQQSLETVDRERRIEYPYLHPSVIANSIHI